MVKSKSNKSNKTILIIIAVILIIAVIFFIASAFNIGFSPDSKVNLSPKDDGGVVIPTTTKQACPEGTLETTNDGNTYEYSCEPRLNYCDIEQELKDSNGNKYTCSGSQVCCFNKNDNIKCGDKKLIQADGSVNTKVTFSCLSKNDPQGTYKCTQETSQYLGGSVVNGYCLGSDGKTKDSTQYCCQRTSK